MNQKEKYENIQNQRNNEKTKLALNVTITSITETVTGCEWFKS